MLLYAGSGCENSISKWQLQFVIVLLAFTQMCQGFSSVFNSMRRTDGSSEATYHFTKVNHYEPVTEPIIYANGYGDKDEMIVGFSNMIVFAKFENDKHFVIRVNEDLDEDIGNVSHFLTDDDSGELFDIVTLKPTTTSTTTTHPYTSDG
ncbi:hypothetical protein Bhyg_12679 [Pseudolycoriella hygida]|uniref:Uncharacterized protein n=1 Tax=Pseudolycoriella hygida TaxID=35572 RepID=A0A9Q0S0M3_9DIPT|nr:hypothetical protein Bhyg_12679 [Pseudolycoriella hygida]